MANKESRLLVNLMGFFLLNELSQAAFWRLSCDGPADMRLRARRRESWGVVSVIWHMMIDNKRVCLWFGSLWLIDCLVFVSFEWDR